MVKHSPHVKFSILQISPSDCINTFFWGGDDFDTFIYVVSIYVFLSHSLSLSLSLSLFKVYTFY